MRDDAPQFIESVLPWLAPPLVGVAVFLFIWLFLKPPLQRSLGRVASRKGTPRGGSRAAHVPLGFPGAGSGPAPAERAHGAAASAEPVDRARDGSAAGPLAAAQRDQYLTRWRQAEAQFAREPAEAVGRAERLLRELARERGSTPVAAALLREGQSRSGVVSRSSGSPSDAEFGAALAEAAVGIFRLIRRARAARAGDVAVEPQGASADDLRARMDLYGGVFSRLLGAEHGEPAALAPGTAAGPGVDTHDGRDRGDGRPTGTVPGWAARHWASARWHVFQLVLNLVVSLALLALVFWALSLR